MSSAAIFVLYGATGDLAHRMVIPAFATLCELDLLPDSWQLIGSGRGDVSHEHFASDVGHTLERAGVALGSAAWRRMRSRLRFAGGDFTAEGHGALLNEIVDARSELGAGATLVHYLAIPPQSFEPMTRAIGRHRLNEGARVVFEKPFGTSLSTFRHLDRVVHRVFDESQVFRIDHFLGKEATQNLHVLRFANGLFARMWDRHAIRAVQIDVPETLGITDRADFYDATGVVRDMLVTHLFQVAAEVAMEPPRSLAPADLQAARASVMARFRRLDPADVVIGQYDGYRNIEGVGARSRTPTYLAARLWIDSPRWRGVPFLLRTGKRMHQSAQTVSLVLAEPHGPFDDLPPETNVVTFTLDGSGSVGTRVVAKAAGVGLRLAAAQVEISLADVGDGPALAPYARLLHDVVADDRSLFTRPDALAHAWRVIEPILDLDRRPLPYAPGSRGPAAARRLAAPDGWLLGA